MDTAVRAASRFALDTDDFPPSARHRGLVQAVAQAMQRPFALEVLGPDAPWHYRMEGVLFGSTMIGRLRTAPIEVAIGASQAPDDNIVVELVADGPGFTAEQAGQCIDVGRGQALISMGALPRRNRTVQAVTVLILQMPLRHFLPVIDPGAQRPMRVLPADTPGLLTLEGYLQSIVDAPVEADAAMLRLMSTQLQALCLLLMRSAWPGTSVRGPAAWAHAARAVVAQELADPTLDERRVAARVGISGSYLRKLFAVEGGFAAYLRHERLQRAWLMLRDPLCVSMRVIDIGEACGFGDLSTFNRQFRRCFGATPSQVREGGAGLLAAAAGQAQATQAMDLQGRRA